MSSNQSSQVSQENQGAGYVSSMQGENNMGGGQGVFGSGVAGGYIGNKQQQRTQQPQQQQDWLDKGIEFAGKETGLNIVCGNFQIRQAQVADASSTALQNQQNADKVGDWANQELKKEEGELYASSKKTRGRLRHVARFWITWRPGVVSYQRAHRKQKHQSL